MSAASCVGMMVDFPVPGIWEGATSCIIARASLVADMTV